MRKDREGRYNEKYELPPSRVSELLSYDPVTGIFIWNECPEKPNSWNARRAGKVAGQIDNYGRRIISINFAGKDRRYGASILAWAIMNGAWPTLEIGHRNFVFDDDRWDNLRPATRSQIACGALNRRNKSGLKGVCWYPRNGKWRAMISKDGKNKMLGFFATKEAAGLAYVRASEELHGEYARRS